MRILTRPASAVWSFFEVEEYTLSGIAGECEPPLCPGSIVSPGKESAGTDIAWVANRLCLLVRLRSGLFPESSSLGLEIPGCPLAVSAELRRLCHLLASSFTRDGQQASGSGNGERAGSVWIS